MYAFIDESGNTGPNMFDPAQPVFYSVAVISRFDLDSQYGPIFRRMAAEVGQDSLHANMVGHSRLDPLLPQIQKMVKRDGVRFFIGRIVKRDLVLTKLADTLFDPGENQAVPWHVYNIRFLRLLNVLKLSLVASESVLRTFWEAILNTHPADSEKLFASAVSEMIGNLGRIPDDRSRSVIGDALRWAAKHPETVTVFSSRSLRLNHLPHLVVFPPALHSIERQSKFWSRKVIEIRHDRESLVIAAVRNLHEIISQAPRTEIKWIDQTIPIGAVPDSRFKQVSSEESAGIQLGDLALWLLQQQQRQKPLSSSALSFLQRVIRNAELYELSLSGIEETLSAEFAKVSAHPFDSDSLNSATALLAEVESRRMDAMRKYELQKAERLKEEFRSTP